MQAIGSRKALVDIVICAIALVVFAGTAGAQATKESVSEQGADQATEMRALAESVRELQSQVRELNAQLKELRSQRDPAAVQTGNVTANSYKPEIDGAAKLESQPAPQASYPERPNAVTAGSSQASAQSSAPSSQPQPAEDRMSKLEEDQQFIDSKVNDQYQTKVESGSKYRLRLSGMVLLNLYDTRGMVDNQDFPQVASAMGLLGSPAAFGGSLRQSQLGLDVFGPDVAGAHTSANVRFDFAGGFANTPNGVTEGLVRLRTGTLRFDWRNTSVIGGQDHLFFAPLAPTSLASVATPALSYAGNLWSWTPQIRVEHRYTLSEGSSVSVQAGILDSLTADLPYSSYVRYASWGEASGQPAYATRVSWSQKAYGQEIVVGVAGYYGRQDWGFNRKVDGWAGTADLTVPLGKLFGLTGAFYRGRAVGGLGGGIGQTILLSGNLLLPSSSVIGLNSMGGWMQLKFKPKTNFELNAALGVDNPFASELRRYSPAGSYYGVWLSKNVSPFVNFIYHVRSDVLFSVEYRHLQTFVLDNGSHSANHVNLSVGYLF